MIEATLAAGPVLGVASTARTVPAFGLALLRRDPDPLATGDRTQHTRPFRGICSLSGPPVDLR